MKPGDHVIFPTADGVTYVWRVSGVYLGALGQEDVVGLQSVTRNPPTAHGEDIDEMFVPLALVENHVFENPRARGALASTMDSPVESDGPGSDPTRVRAMRSDGGESPLARAVKEARGGEGPRTFEGYA